MIGVREIGATVLVALLVAALGYAYYKGYDTARDRYEKEIAARIEAGLVLEQARIGLAKERDELLERLNDEATIDPVVIERCLGPSRVRRLNAIR